jgi:GH15 family glucan-1,4-alpha-glucosidase
MWEIEPRHWTQSRLQCVAGLRAVSALPRAGSAEASAWAALADSLLRDATQVGLHPSGRWQRSPDDPRVDSALLLPAVRGAVDVQDPRTRATLAAVLETLVQDGYCYRFQHGEHPLDHTEGAFLLCGFLLSLSLLDQGRLPEAVSWFERTRAAAGPPGLLSEEYDVVQRQLRGNLPQAFVHALLIETATRLNSALTRPSTPSERTSA